MKETTPVERVARVLEGAKFRRIPMPLEIAGLTFQATAAFVGQSPSPDLVLVGDTTSQTTRVLQQTVEGVSRALDVVRSRRPLTVIVLGPRPESGALTALSRYARVLPVGETADEASLANWLAILLPLPLAQAEEAREEDPGLKALAESGDPLAQELVGLAPLGASTVAARFHEMVDEPFADPIESEEPEA